MEPDRCNAYTFGWSRFFFLACPDSDAGLCSQNGRFPWQRMQPVSISRSIRRSGVSHSRHDASCIWRTADGLDPLPAGGLRTSASWQWLSRAGLPIAAAITGSWVIRRGFLLSGRYQDHFPVLCRLCRGRAAYAVNPARGFPSLRSVTAASRPLLWRHREMVPEQPKETDHGNHRNPDPEG